MHMATKLKALRFNKRIIEAFERYCEQAEKRQTALLEDLIVEFLKSKKAWPPKGAK
jgi:hypothetical protein